MDIVKTIANTTGSQFIELRRLSAEIVREVARANSLELVFDGEEGLDIVERCRQFKELLEANGFDNLPENCKDIYQKIIRPLYFYQIERTL